MEKIQAKRAKSPRSRTIDGTAVATMVASIGARPIVSITPIRTCPRPAWRVGVACVALFMHRAFYDPASRFAVWPQGRRGRDQGHRDQTEARSIHRRHAGHQSLRIPGVCVGQTGSRHASGIAVQCVQVIEQTEGVERRGAGRRVVEDAPDRHMLRDLHEAPGQPGKVGLVVGIVVHARRAM